MSHYYSYTLSLHYALPICRGNFIRPTPRSLQEFAAKLFGELFDAPQSLVQILGKLALGHQVDFGRNRLGQFRELLSLALGLGSVNLAPFRRRLCLRGLVDRQAMLGVRRPRHGGIPRIKVRILSIGNHRAKEHTYQQPHRRFHGLGPPPGESLGSSAYST